MGRTCLPICNPISLAFHRLPAVELSLLDFCSSLKDNNCVDFVSPMQLRLCGVTEYNVGYVYKIRAGESIKLQIEIVLLYLIQKIRL